MSSALYDVVCTRIEQDHVPELMPALLAGKLFRYHARAKPKKNEPGYFQQALPKPISVFSPQVRKAAIVAAKWAVENSQQVHLWNAVAQAVVKTDEDVAGIEPAAALEAMRASATVALDASRTLLGRQALYWTQWLLHTASPQHYVAPRAALLELKIATAYSTRDMPLPIFEAGQRSLAFRVIASASWPNKATSPIEEAARTRWDKLDAAALDVFLDFDAAKPKKSGKLANGEERQVSTWTLIVFPSLLAGLDTGAKWDTTAYPDDLHNIKKGSWGYVMGKHRR